MERPALQRLLADIGEGLVDVVVVYKVDRLTRSLADFAKMVELFDAHGVSFVAVTQQFNTTTSMGRLTLNVLLSFAQFEREVTGERIRDKIAASKRKGMWMGGVPPLGYDVRERRLVVNPAEAETVRLHLRALPGTRLRPAAQQGTDRRGIVSKVRVSQKGIKSGGCRFSRGALVRAAGQPDLHRRDPPQAGAPSRAARGDSAARALGESAAAAARECGARPRNLEPGRLRVRWRESSSTQMVSRCMCRERPRAGGATAITSPKPG